MVEHLNVQARLLDPVHQLRWDNAVLERLNKTEYGSIGSLICNDNTDTYSQDLQLCPEQNKKKPSYTVQRSAFLICAVDLSPINGLQSCWTACEECCHSDFFAVVR